MLPVSTLAALLFFGSVVFAYATLRVARVVRSKSEAAPIEPSATEKTAEQTSKSGLAPNLESVEHLARAGTETGLLAFLTWICENKPVFEHAGKIHDLDYFTFLVVVAFLVAFLYSVHVSSKDLGILNRDQTEEWRGFMQMIFLLYHYFALEEVYPLIRLFISCYVFLTGFGNTSFFYLKRDYSIVRLLSMLWRLCFSCLVLAITHNNPIILYYIVPLHTFYFLVAYVTMSLFEKQINYTKYGLKLKLVGLGCLLYIVWEFSPVFEAVFGLVSNEPHPGAPVGAYGTRYEWQFRSGLDHYSAFFGMVFACTFPLVELRDTKVFLQSRTMQILLAIIFSTGLLMWSLFLFPLPKLEFNARHPYTFMIPMVGYLFLRNLTPYLRRVHLAMFATAGKYTLETYLLQHHVWLTSNAKTVLVLLPGFPKTNFIIVSALYFALSVKLFNLTVETKTLLIPSDNGREAIRNLVTLGGYLGLCFFLAQCLVLLGIGILGALFFTMVLAIMLTLAARKFIQDHQQTENGFGHLGRVLLTVLAVFFLIVGLVCSAFPTEAPVNATTCDPNNGHWVTQFAGQCGQQPQSSYTYCSARGWTWDIMDQKTCGWKRVTKLSAVESDIVLLGSGREYAYAFASIENPNYMFGTSFADGRIMIVSSTQELDSLQKENLILVCQEQKFFSACTNLKKGISVILKEKAEDVPEGASLVVDVDKIKSTADKRDVIGGTVYRDDVYAVVAQIILNHAIRMETKPTKASPPPPGGLAHNPLLGALFLGLAFYTLFKNDGFLGLISTLSSLMGKESAVTWEEAMEKVHANVPGLDEKHATEATVSPSNGRKAESQEQEAEADLEEAPETEGTKLISRG